MGTATQGDETGKQRMTTKWEEGAAAGGEAVLPVVVCSAVREEREKKGEREGRKRKGETVKGERQRGKEKRRQGVSRIRGGSREWVPRLQREATHVERGKGKHGGNRD